MSIPDFRTIMPVLLGHLSDLQEHSDREITQAMADHFCLSLEERTRFLPNSDRKVFVDRVAWAKTELGMAGLIEISGRGRAVITERGLSVLQQAPRSMEREFLKQFPEYRERMGSANAGQEEVLSLREEEYYPREEMEGAYERLRQDLAAELLKRLHKGSANLFRRLIIDLLVAMGYGGTLRDAVRSIGTTGEQGVEGTIRADRLGVESIHLQAKRREKPLGRGEIQSFARAMEAKQVTRGILMTTSGFSQEAVWCATGFQQPMVLVNGDDLADLMIDFDVGVSTIAVYTVKGIDEDVFGEG